MKASRGDRGSVTIWLAIASFVMIVLVGIAVDLTGQVAAQQHAHDIAAQAARVAGEQLDNGAAVHGTVALVDTAPAVTAATTYLTASGMTGTVTVTDAGATVRVVATTTYTTKFLSIIGITSLQVTGTSTAQGVKAVNGARR